MPYYVGCRHALALSTCFVTLKASHGEQYEGDDKHSSTYDINGGGAEIPPNQKIIDKPWRTMINFKWRKTLLTEKEVRYYLGRNPISSWPTSWILQV